METKQTEKKPYSIIETGGKQYIVSENDIINIEKTSDSNKVGDKITFDSVLLTDDGSSTNVGTPVVDSAKVEGEIIEVGRKKKVNVIKYKAKVNYFRKLGHRQHFLKVKITSL